MTTTTAPHLPYLERLLDGETVEWKTLGEVAEIGTGSSNRLDEEEPHFRSVFSCEAILCVEMSFLGLYMLL